jgi:hypothetical protein
VLGSVGNSFEDYKLALTVRGGGTSNNATIVTPATTTTLVSGFMMISVTPSGTPKTGNASEDAPAPNGVPGGDQAVRSALANEESALVDLFGSTLKNGTETAKAIFPNGVVPTNGTETAKGVFLNFPVPLRLDEIAPAPGTPPPNFDDAVSKAKANPDIETVFFVNFVPGGLTGDALKGLQDLQSQVRSWQAWSSTLSEGKLQEQIDKKALPADSNGPSMAARSSYRSKVFDYLMRRSTWYAFALSYLPATLADLFFRFAKTFEQLMSKHIETKTVEFHTAILTAVLEGFTIPTSVFGQLEKILGSISDGIIQAGSSSKAENMQYWIMLTRYDHQNITQTVLPSTFPT